MSAFICSDKHINTIVTWAGKHNVSAYHGVPGRSYPVSGNEQEVANELLDENVKSVNYRYKEDDPVEPIGFVFEDDASAIQIYKLCQSLACQSCEHPEWETSLSKAYVNAIQNRAVQSVPGYESAKWSI